MRKASETLRRRTFPDVYRTLKMLTSGKVKVLYDRLLQHGLRTFRTFALYSRMRETHCVLMIRVFTRIYVFRDANVRNVRACARKVLCIKELDAPDVVARTSGPTSGTSDR